MAGKFKKNIKKWKEDVRKERVKRETISVKPQKSKKKRMPVAGKCSPGKVLKGNKCVPRRKIEP